MMMSTMGASSGARKRKKNTGSRKTGVYTAKNAQSTISPHGAHHPPQPVSHQHVPHPPPPRRGMLPGITAVAAEMPPSVPEPVSAPGSYNYATPSAGGGIPGGYLPSFGRQLSHEGYGGAQQFVPVRAQYEALPQQQQQHPSYSQPHPQEETPTFEHVAIEALSVGPLSRKTSAARPPPNGIDPTASASALFQDPLYGIDGGGATVVELQVSATANTSNLKLPELNHLELKHTSMDHSTMYPDEPKSPTSPGGTATHNRKGGKRYNISYKATYLQLQQQENTLINWTLCCQCRDPRGENQQKMSTTNKCIKQWCRCVCWKVLLYWIVGVVMSADLYFMFRNWKKSYYRHLHSFERWNAAFIASRVRDITRIKGIGIHPSEIFHDDPPRVERNGLKKIVASIVSSECAPFASIARYTAAVKKDMDTTYWIPTLLGYIELVCVGVASVDHFGWREERDWQESLRQYCGYILLCAIFIHVCFIFMARKLAQIHLRRIKGFKRTLKSYFSKMLEDDDDELKVIVDTDHKEVFVMLQKWLNVVKIADSDRWHLAQDLFYFALWKYIFLFDAALIMIFNINWYTLVFSLLLLIGLVISGQMSLDQDTTPSITDALRTLLWIFIWPGILVILVFSYIIYAAKFQPKFAPAAMVGVMPFAITSSYILLTGWRIIFFFEWLTILMFYGSLTCYYPQWMPRVLTVLFALFSEYAFYVSLQKHIHYLSLKNSIEMLEYSNKYFRTSNYRWFWSWIRDALFPPTVDADFSNFLVQHLEYEEENDFGGRYYQ